MGASFRSPSGASGDQQHFAKPSRVASYYLDPGLNPSFDSSDTLSQILGRTPGSTHLPGEEPAGVPRTHHGYSQDFNKPGLSFEPHLKHLGKPTAIDKVQVK